MLYPKDNSFVETRSPHSLGLKNNLTIPNPGWDQNQLMINQKKDWGAGGLYGVSANNKRYHTVKDDYDWSKYHGGQTGLNGLSFDGTGLWGTGLFSGDITTWGVPEVMAGLVGAYAFYSMFHQGKQTKYRLEMSQGRRRKSKAAKLRAKAKRLEEQTTGIF